MGLGFWGSPQGGLYAQGQNVFRLVFLLYEPPWSCYLENPQAQHKAGGSLGRSRLFTSMCACLALCCVIPYLVGFLRTKFGVTLKPV